MEWLGLYSLKLCFLQPFLALYFMLEAFAVPWLSGEGENGVGISAIRFVGRL